MLLYKHILKQIVDDKWDIFRSFLTILHTSKNWDVDTQRFHKKDYFGSESI